MRVFIDFEASSLGKHSYPVEVGWVFEDGREEAHLIRPPEVWTDWDARAERIHGIARETLVRDGEPVAEVAQRMVDALGGHELLASAPSWDGKWLSVLLRAGGQPRHALRLADSDDALAQAAIAPLAPFLAEPELAVRAAAIRATAALDEPPPRHRALDDARDMYALWRRVSRLAGDEARALSASRTKMDESPRH